MEPRSPCQVQELEAESFNNQPTQKLPPQNPVRSRSTHS